MTFPRRLVESTAGARVVQGPGLERIVAEERAAVDAYEHGRRKIRDAVDHLPRTIAYLLLLAVGPALLVITFVWLLYGREPRTGYDREYEQQPPSDLPPALVPALLHERKSAVNVALAFTATLFDLIQRGRYLSTPVTSEEKRWRGERTESVADLELGQGAQDGQLDDLEKPVAEVMDDVLDEGPVLLTACAGPHCRRAQEERRTVLQLPEPHLEGDPRAQVVRAGLRRQDHGLVDPGVHRRPASCCSSSAPCGSTQPLPRGPTC